MTRTWYLNMTRVTSRTGLRTGVWGGDAAVAGTSACVPLLIGAACALVSGCGGAGGGGEEIPRDTRGLERAEQSIRDKSREGVPPMLIDNTPVEWSRIEPRLAEAAGGMVVEEIILEELLRAEVARRSAAVTAKEIDQERALLEDQLVTSAKANPEQAARLIQRMQTTRGLGPVRFRALLERNAMLRVLVKDAVEVTGEMIDQELRVRFGAKEKCRLIVVATEAQAVALRQRLDIGEGELVERFAAEARVVSLDPSARDGGEIDPISVDDTSYSASVRNALRMLEPGKLSPVILLENGFALIVRTGQVAAVNPPAGAREAALSDLRLRQERIAMDRLAQRLMSSAPVTVFDPSLAWAWKTRLAASDQR